MMSETLIPVAAMARRLRVPIRWLRDEVKSGRLPHLRAGSAILVHPETIERLLLDRALEGAGTESKS